MKSFKHLAPKLLVIIVIGFITNPALSEPFKVGIIAPLSGYVADYGIAEKNGVELAISEIEESKQNSIKFIYEDSRYDAKISLSAFNKLTKNDKVDILYVFGTNASSVLAPLAEQNKIPLVSLSGEPFVAGGRKYVIDFHNRLGDMAILTLEYLRSNGYRKFGIVKTEVQYLESLVNGFKSNLTNNESLVIIDSFLPETNPDLNTAVAKVKRGLANNDFDAIGVFLLTGQISSFYKKMAVYKINPPTFGSDVLGQIDEMKKAGQTSTAGIYGGFSVSKDFAKKYYEKFGNYAQLQYAANAYDFAKLVYAEFSDTTVELDADAILKSIENTRPRSGASGDFYFLNENSTKLENPGKRFIFPIVIKKVLEDGSSIELSNDWKKNH